MEQVNEDFWGSPNAANFGRLRLGILHSRTVPFPGGCKCLWWGHHFCRFSHLHLDRWKLPSVPDNQGVWRIKKSVRLKKKKKNSCQLLDVMKIDLSAPRKHRVNSASFCAWVEIKFISTSVSLHYLHTIHLLTSWALIPSDEIFISEMSMKNHLVRTHRGRGIQME